MRSGLLLAAALCLAAPAVPAQVPATAGAAAATPRGDLAARLETLVGPDAEGLRFDVQPANGALLRLSAAPGTTLPLAGDDATARALDFAARFGPLFGATDAVALDAPRALSPDAEGRPRWMVMPQRVHGFDLIGHGLWLQLDAQGRATAAHGLISPAGAELPPPAISGAEAIATAVSHLGLDAADMMAEPALHGIGRALPGGAELLWRVELLTRHGLVPLAVEVRAADGTVARVIENNSTGGETGTLVYNNTTNTFSTGKGKGRGYKSVKDALIGKDGNVSLASLTKEDVGYLPYHGDGTLTGRYCRITTFENTYVFSSNHSFPFSDDSELMLSGFYPEYEAFDHVNTYSWLTRMAGYLSKVMGTLPTDTCLPVIVNFDNEGYGFANAYYSPGDIDGANGYDSGFFVFGDLDEITNDACDDISRDPSVVCHEYTHGVVDKGGNSFGNDLLDTPPRAVNEALADYAAASYLNDPLIGRVFMTNSAADIGASGNVLRDLTSEVTLPDNLWDTVGGSTGLPEEHQAGQIFGAALWRARGALKSKTADALILNHLPGWPQSSAEAGYPAVTPINASAAYAAYDYQCFAAMMDTLLADTKKGAKSAGALLGAFLAHGLTGVDPSTTYTLDATAGGKGFKLDIDSAFLGSLNEHSFLLELGAGQALDISVKGDKKDGTKVDFSFDDDPGDFTYDKPKKQKSDGSSADQKKILVNVAGTYLVTILDTDSGGGRYQARLKVK